MAFASAGVVSGVFAHSDTLAWLSRNWLALILLCVAFGLLLFTVGSDRGKQATMPPIRPISIWVVVAGLIAAAVCTWLTIEFLLDAIVHADAAERPGLRIDAIRTGVTIGIGAGGAVTLLLAARRQWLGERSQAHTEEDAVERRITELYTRAIDQIGSKNAAVRLGGAYALERLAKQHVGIRQSIVNVLCGYLRMSFPVDRMNLDKIDAAKPEEDNYLSVDEERHVRLAVQNVLFNNLRNGDEEGQTWPDIDLYLRGAHLEGVDFSGCRVRSLDMSDCRLVGQSKFDRLRVEQNASFDGARFRESATFWDAIFSGVATFRAVRFEGYAVFIRTEFFDDANFDGASFSEYCWFSKSRFRSGATFSETEFCGTVDFDEAIFSARMVYLDKVKWRGPVYFGEACFEGIVHIIHCEFADTCNFSKTSFLKSARFDFGKFSGRTLFVDSEFNDAWFTGAEFADVVSFKGARVKGEAYFDRVAFENDVIFNKSRFDKMLDLSGSFLLAQLQVQDATFAAGADLDRSLISDHAYGAVDALWPSEWVSTIVPYRKGGFSFEINHMSRAPLNEER